MTREERQYFYSCLQKMFAEWVVEHEEEWIYLNSKNLLSFADRYMETITGQQPLPQAVFRMFLEEYAPVFKGVEAKQDKEDAGLDTNDKTVVGAINELREAVINSGGGGEGAKEVIELLNEEELNRLKDPSREVIYITLDTGMLYIYDGKTFINVTNQEVDNTIYVSDLNSLFNMINKEGVFTVLYTRRTPPMITTLTYTLNVSKRQRGGSIIYIPILSNNDGWAEAVTVNGVKQWQWHNYLYDIDDNLTTEDKSVIGVINSLIVENEELKKKLKEVEDLAYAGL